MIALATSSHVKPQKCRFSLMKRAVELANYPPQSIEVIEREQGRAELVATLMGTTADPRELDEIVARLDKHPGVENASWSLRTTE
jgi:putative Mg2+ transporter-C (MgtC) family protein